MHVELMMLIKQCHMSGNVAITITSLVLFSIDYPIVVVVVVLFLFLYIAYIILLICCLVLAVAWFMDVILSIYLFT